jgi:uncharacterized delta-60 repeat protein
MKKLYLIASLCSVVMQLKADGTLDTTFGINGYSTIPNALIINGICQQGNGKILVSGTGSLITFQVMRFLPNGMLDVTFGENGITESSFGVVSDLAVDELFRIVVAGQDIFGNFQLTRFLRDGNLDYTFGYSGTAFGPSGFCASVALQSDGKIVAAGGDNSGNATVVRYNNDGSIDLAFESGPEGFFEDVKIGVDGTIVATGTDSSGFTQLVRYLSDGSLDGSFGTSGIATGPQGPGTSVVITPNGDYLVGGYDVSTPHNMQLTQFDNNGSIDTSYGTNGIADLTPGIINDVILQADGKVVAVGLNGSDTAIVRYTTGGVLDITFGINGIGTAIPGSFVNAATQLDGNIIAAGLDQYASQALLAKYVGSSALQETAITSPAYAATGTVTFDGVAQAPGIVYLLLDGVLQGGTATISNTNDWSLGVTIANPGEYNARAVSLYQDGHEHATNIQYIRVYG